MSNKLGNEPAYPFVETITGCSVTPGMSQRTVIAMHAPNKAPDWFIHTPEGELPELPSIDEVKDEEHRKIVKDWRHDPIYDLPEELWWFQEKTSKAFDARREWQRKDEENRYFQWRIYFAQRLLAELNKQ